MPATSQGWRLNVSQETDDRVSDAAARLDITKSQFVADAARSAADDVLGRGDVTLMDPEVFAALVESLDTPDPAPALELAAESVQRSRLA